MYLYMLVGMCVQAMFRSSFVCFLIFSFAYLIPHPTLCPLCQHFLHSHTLSYSFPSQLLPLFAFFFLSSVSFLYFILSSSFLYTYYPSFISSFYCFIFPSSFLSSFYLFFFLSSFPPFSLLSLPLFHS